MGLNQERIEKIRRFAQMVKMFDPETGQDIEDLLNAPSAGEEIIDQLKSSRDAIRDELEEVEENLRRLDGIMSGLLPQ